MGTDATDRQDRERSPSASGPEGKDPESRVISGDWENRLLCGEEDCMGVVGSDGRCRECGRAHDVGC